MAITKKTFNQIIKQNSFSGADAGKLLIMDYVNKMTKGKRLLTDDDLHQIYRCMNHSPKQLEIYNSYKAFKDRLTLFYGFFQTAYCQYEMGRRINLLSIVDIAKKIQNFETYLKQPLLLTEKEYSKLQADAIKDFENKNIPIWAVVMFYTLSLVRDYSNKKAIPENIKTLIESYKGKSINVDYEIASEKDRNQQNALFIIYFCDKYKIDNTEKSIRDFIINSPLMYAYTCMDKDDSFLSEKNTISLIELYEREREKQAKYNGEKYKSLFIQSSTVKTQNKTEIIDKLESLINLSDNLDFYPSYSDVTLDALSKDIWNKLTTYFSELVEAVKNILSGKIKKLGSTSISSENPDTIKEKELLKAGIDTLSENTVIRNYFLSITDMGKDNIEYIRHNKVYNAGISVYKNETEPSNTGLATEKKLLKEYADLGYFFKEIGREDVKDTTKGLIEQSLCMYLGCIDIFEVYSEIFKVDATPLSEKWNIDSDLAAYNWVLSNNYNSFLGTQKAIEANRETLKDTFKPLDKRLYKLSPEEKETIKNNLFDIPLEETLSTQYLRLFLQGANVHYE